MAETLTLDQMLDLLGEHAHHVLLEEREPSIMPIFHLCLSGKKDLIISCPWRNTEAKHNMVAQLKIIARERGAVKVGFLSEMWLSEQKPGVDMTQVDPPSQQPNRQECVMAVVNDGKTTKDRAWRIIRDWKGRIRTLELMSSEGHEQISSWIIDGIIQRK